MKHFTLEEWADFVRGIGAPERLREMQAHARECRKCQGVEGLWRSLHRHGTQAQTRSAPPASSLHLLKAAFAVQKNQKGIPRAVRFARLIFDSLLDPLPADVRASSAPCGSHARQVLFGAPPYVLDLRMEEEPGSLQVHLAGQVMHSVRPERAVKDFSVFLRNETNILKETIGNIFGEFYLEFEPGESLVLLVKIPRQKPICLPLPDVKVRAQGQGLARIE